ncbi:MAG: hypothetical protein KF886_17775 [Candidatus Hydrogenedentes bacterium]|nr:hypothetical protein [Candidatus Hydrogenedentota bacterium]
MILTKRERFERFLEWLRVAPPADSFEGAYALVCTTLNAVEDAFSGIPYAPERWQSDGRLYPPQLDSLRPGRSNERVTCLRSRAHYLYIGDNGAIEIQTIPAGDVILQKPGVDGLGLWKS